MKEYVKAIEYFKKTVSKYASDPAPFYNMGVSYLYLDSNQAALENFSSAINLKPNDTLFYLHRGMAYYKLKMLDSACEDWLKASELGCISARN